MGGTSRIGDIEAAASTFKNQGSPAGAQQTQTPAPQPRAAVPGPALAQAELGKTERAELVSALVDNTLDRVAVRMGFNTETCGGRDSYRELRGKYGYSLYGFTGLGRNFATDILDRGSGSWGFSPQDKIRSSNGQTLWFDTLERKVFHNRGVITADEKVEASLRDRGVDTYKGSFMITNYPLQVGWAGSGQVQPAYADQLLDKGATHKELAAFELMVFFPPSSGDDRDFGMVPGRTIIIDVFMPEPIQKYLSENGGEGLERDLLVEYMRKAFPEVYGGVAASLKSTGAPALDEMPAFDIEELKSGK